jgi:hypothetical protein
MTRLSFRLTDELLREMMTVAARHGTFSYTAVILRALKLWVLCMTLRHYILSEVEIWNASDEIDPDNATRIAELLAEVANVLEEK